MMSAAEEIKKGNIANLYLFYGEEAYKRRYYKELLKKAVAGGNTMNLSEYEGKDIDWQAVYDTSQTLPFFAQKRLLIIENSGKFKAGKSSGEEGEALQTIILASSVLYELIGPASAKLSLYLSGSYSERLEDVVSVEEQGENGEQKSSLELLIERIEKIQKELPAHEINENEEAFTEAAERYHENMVQPRLGGRFRRPMH